MAIDRRNFIAGLVTGAGAAVCPYGRARAVPVQRFAAARRAPDGGHFAAIISERGEDVRAVALPGRGHDIAVCPVTRRCVAFARRPGDFAVAFSADATVEPEAFETPADRHFYGHGVFSADGRLLYTTENDFEGGRGIIGIYDATAGFRRVGEFLSHGVGPHDLAFLPGARILVVANGGLREHPDIGRGRRVLNLEAIETSLVYMDVKTGDLIEKHPIAAGGALSLRHLEIGENGTVVLGAQIVNDVPGARPRTEALIYRHRRQQELVATALPSDAAAALAGYVSSVAVDSGGTIAAATSSKAGAVVMLDVASGKVLGVRRMPDISGVAGLDRPGAFLVTSGKGVVASVDCLASPVYASAYAWNWDNHAVYLGV